MEIYIAKRGDNVEEISKNFGVGVAEIAYVNQLPFPYKLAVGQSLLIPTNTADSTAKKTVTSRGYAYPFISEWVLEQTLPYLTELAVFSYGFTTTGDLVPPTLDDAWMIELAEENGVMAILTLTPLDEEGRFNNYLITSLLSNQEAQQNLTDQILETLRAKNFSGIDVDFEYIPPENRISYAQFVADLREAVAPEGYSVSVDLAPKVSEDQPGLLYEGKDYGLLGGAADNVLLMTYEWGYTYEHV